MPDARSGAAPLAEESVAGFEDINELLRQQAGAAPVSPGGAPAPIAWSPAGFQPAPYSPPSASDTLDMVVVSRSAIYTQAALFLVVAGVSFGIGYWVGQSRAPAAVTATTKPVEKPKADAVRLAGTIAYTISMGHTVADDGAIILALPIKAPRDKLKAKGLGPGQVKDAARDTAGARIATAGGGYARADEHGTYQLDVQPGEYHVLVISAHAERPSDQILPEADLNTLAEYFDVVVDLLSSHQYWLVRRRLAGKPSLSYTF